MSGSQSVAVAVENTPVKKILLHRKQGEDNLQRQKGEALFGIAVLIYGPHPCEGKFLLLI